MTRILIGDENKSSQNVRVMEKKYINFPTYSIDVHLGYDVI